MSALQPDYGGALEGYASHIVVHPDMHQRRLAEGI